MPTRPLGIGFIGSGFSTRFHMQAFQAVRDAEVRGVWSPDRKHAESAAAYARTLDIGQCRPYRSIAEMVVDPEIDAVWLCGYKTSRN
jgi:predicted dehydrogenase